MILCLLEAKIGTSLEKDGSQLRKGDDQLGSPAIMMNKY